jgi:hypothetical protein
MKTFSLSATVCHWIARILGTLFVVVLAILAIVYRARLPNLSALSPISYVGLLGFALMLTGMLIGWRWELAGGILSLVGVLLLVEPTRVNGRITWFFAVMAAPGVLYITSHLLRRVASRHTTAQPPTGSSV